LDPQKLYTQDGSVRQYFWFDMCEMNMFPANRQLIQKSPINLAVIGGNRNTTKMTATKLENE
jgi:hypothetical protein